MDRISESRALVPLVPAEIVVREPPPTFNVIVTQPQLPPPPTIITTAASQSSHQLQDIQQSSFSSTSTVSSQGSGGSAKPTVIEKLSRPMAFDKMESLVREMQDGECGVPVRSQKQIFTSIPSVFMGYDLVEWLMSRVGVEECEALNIAFQLCLHGYLFPVNDWKNLFVKDDSTFYRFQTPYYWPWQQKPPDNVEYAIYLVKRSLRNKQKHGLEDYELEALNSLHKNLKGKWEFINLQAEEQIRLAKERKKGDKQVSDSQERAYWRVHRPPPGQFTPLEPCPVPSRSKPRKKTIEDWNRELAMLRNSFGRNRMKMSQACDLLVQYYETYGEFDPMMTPAQPTNPWVTDDISFWQFNAPHVEVLSEKRVKKWAISIEDCVADPMGLQEFTAYLKKEYSHENIRFWEAVTDLRRSSASSVVKKVKAIYDEFLSPNAPCEINVDGKTMEQVQAGLKNPSRFAFDVAAEHVYALLLKKDCYPRFVRSEHYKNLVANAVQPSSKKSFFRFGGGAAKKKGSTSQGPNTNTLHGPQVMNTIGSIRGRRGSDRSLTGSAGELAVYGTKETTRVPHSHSQSNLNDTSVGLSSDTSKFANKLDISIELPSNIDAVCPWDTDEVPIIVSEASTNPTESDAIHDVLDKMKRSCRLIQQNTLDSDFHSSKKLQTCVTEHRRASMTNITDFSASQLTQRTSSFSDKKSLEATMISSSATSLLQHQQPQFIQPQGPKLAISSSTPLLTIETRNIQRATIPEESSRANSEVDLQRKLSSESAKKISLDLSVSEVDKSSSQSSLPVINVTDNEGVTEDLVLEQEEDLLPVETKKESLEAEMSPVTPVTPVEVKTEEKTTEKEIQSDVAVKEVVPSTSVSKTNYHFCENNPHVQIIEIEIETHAEPSPPEEQIISKENIPNVMRKLSVHEEAEKQHETEETEDDEDDDSDSSFVPGYVAPAPTPAPSIAPLAEMDNDEEDDENATIIADEITRPIEPRIICEHKKKEKRRKKKPEAAASSSTTATKKDSEPLKGNPVCPWEDDLDTTQTEGSFVKTYATLGYL
ncbi:uncharacterized protein LOC134835715 [Culicoides brevitarsis]|uniref:uncharacterized protein LOC134835715 n=1 Tax=Culicoides brevitarsis TaxID=469753 RepID=UPI00307B3194